MKPLDTTKALVTHSRETTAAVSALELRAEHATRALARAPSPDRRADLIREIGLLKSAATTILIHELENQSPMAGHVARLLDLLGSPLDAHLHVEYAPRQLSALLSVLPDLPSGAGAPIQQAIQEERSLRLGLHELDALVTASTASLVQLSPRFLDDRSIRADAGKLLASLDPAGLAALGPDPSLDGLAERLILLGGALPTGVGDGGNLPIDTAAVEALARLVRRGTPGRKELLDKLEPIGTGLPTATVRDALDVAAGLLLRQVPALGLSRSGALALGEMVGVLSHAERIFVDRLVAFGLLDPVDLQLIEQGQAEAAERAQRENSAFVKRNTAGQIGLIALSTISYAPLFLLGGIPGQLAMAATYLGVVFGVQRPLMAKLQEHKGLVLDSVGIDELAGKEVRRELLMLTERIASGALLQSTVDLQPDQVASELALARLVQAGKEAAAAGVTVQETMIEPIVNAFCTGLAQLLARGDSLRGPELHEQVFALWREVVDGVAIDRAMRQALLDSSPELAAPVDARTAARLVQGSLEEWARKVPEAFRGTATGPRSTDLVATAAEGGGYQVTGRFHGPDGLDKTGRVALRMAPDGSFDAASVQFDVGPHHAMDSAEGVVRRALRMQGDEGEPSALMCRPVDPQSGPAGWYTVTGELRNSSHAEFQVRVSPMGIPDPRTMLLR